MDNGTVMAMGGRLLLTGMLSGDGTLAAAQGATLQESGGGTFSGMIEGPGKVHIGKMITLDAGTTLAVHTLQDTADINLGNGTNLTNMKGNTFSIGSTPPAMDGSPHRAQTIHITGLGSGSFANTGLLKSLSDAQFLVAFSNTSTVSVVGGTLGMEQAVTGAGHLQRFRRARCWTWRAVAISPPNCRVRARSSSTRASRSTRGQAWPPRA